MKMLCGYGHHPDCLRSQVVANGNHNIPQGKQIYLFIDLVCIMLHCHQYPTKINNA